MFRRHDEPHSLAPTRDLIEIIAILAAGIWAIYIFAYEQRIKPAGEPPSVLLSGSLHRLGTHNGLIQLGFKGTVRNTGHADVSLIALGTTADGLRYTTKGTPFFNRPYPGSTLFGRDARVGARTLVYRQSELSSFVDKRFSSGITISPGEEIPFSSIFLVKSGEFDAVTLYGSAAFAKNGTAGAYPTKIGYTRAGAIVFSPMSDNSNYHSLEVTLDQITLW